MKRPIRSGLLACGLAAVMAVGFAVPAGAVTVTVSTPYGTCTMDGSGGTYTATVTNYTCGQVRARIGYRDQAGTVRYSYGSWHPVSSVATAPTALITQRAGQGTKNGTLSGFVAY